MTHISFSFQNKKQRNMISLSSFVLLLIYFIVQFLLQFQGGFRRMQIHRFLQYSSGTHVHDITQRLHWLCPSQATNGDQHPLLDRAAPKRPPAVAGQGAHTDGLPEHPLLQRLLGNLLLLLLLLFIRPLPAQQSSDQNTQPPWRQQDEEVALSFTSSPLLPVTCP